MTSLVDAQFTPVNTATGTILRPFPGFESVYQGQSGTIPLVFPGTLDPDAGKRGFSPYLLRGVPCPVGAKTLIWLPAVAEQITVEATPVQIDYGYVIHWRLRTVRDQRNDFEAKRAVPRNAHITEQDVGAADTLLSPATVNDAAAGERFLLPSCTETVVFEQAEPTNASFLGGTPGAGVGNLRTQGIAVPSDGNEGGASFGLPLLPPGSAPNFANAFPPGNVAPLGAFQQGVVDPSQYDLAPYSLFRPYFTVAKGDEMMIACVRRPLLNLPPISQVPNWDFTFVDRVFSDLYGTNVVGPTHPPFRNLGIYVMFGSNPS